MEISSSNSWQEEMAVRQPPAGSQKEAETDTPSRFQGIKFGRTGQGFTRFK